MFGGADALRLQLKTLLLMTESEAVARYFVHSDCVIMLRNITIVDIGGGSSDVFLHLEHGDSMKSLQTSYATGKTCCLICCMTTGSSFRIDQQDSKQKSGAYE